MGERKGQNHYYPPDFDPQKHRNLAGYHGQHPLRERARKLHQGILIIRFEMPYNIWCDGCNKHIGMGVRYNAEKSKVGMYYTTPIYKFRMKCHLCDNYMEIKTDPANHEYVIISGARRKEQRWDPKENEQIVTDDKVLQKKLASDPMYKLEHGTEDHARGKVSQRGIGQIEHIQERLKDDYMVNKLARQRFRDEKKSLKAEAESDKALLEKSSLALDLVNEHEDDLKVAQLLKYTTVDSYENKQKQKREEITSRPLFSPQSEVSKKPIKTPSPRQSKQYGNTESNKLALAGRKSKMDPFSVSNTSSWKSLSLAGVGIRRKTDKEHDDNIQNDIDTIDSREDGQETVQVASGTFTSLSPVAAPENDDVVHSAPSSTTVSSVETNDIVPNTLSEGNSVTAGSDSRTCEDLTGGSSICVTSDSKPIVCNRTDSEQDSRDSSINVIQQNALNILMSTYDSSSDTSEDNS